MANPFKRFGEYFAAKSVKQKILFIIGVLLLAVFVFFFIKGNFFDNHAKSTETSYSTSQDGASSGDETQAEQSPPKFRINFFDVGIVVIVIILFVIHKIREKQKFRR